MGPTHGRVAMTVMPWLAGEAGLSGFADRLPRRQVMIACDLARMGGRPCRPGGQPRITGIRSIRLAWRTSFPPVSRAGTGKNGRDSARLDSRFPGLSPFGVSPAPIVNHQ